MSRKAYKLTVLPFTKVHDLECPYCGRDQQAKGTVRYDGARGRLDIHCWFCGGYYAMRPRLERPDDTGD